MGQGDLAGGGISFHLQIQSASHTILWHFALAGLFIGCRTIRHTARWWIRYETQYAFGYCVHVDFVVYYHDRMCLVEYDGRQHYHPVKYFGGRWSSIHQRMRDTVEEWECKDRGITLIRIKYSVPLEQIEEILLESLN